MNRKEKVIIALFLIGTGAISAWATNDTIGVTVGTGKVANLIKFATNVISETGICDATTENQCAAVSAGGAVKVDGSAATQPVSGTVSITGVSTAANQATEITSLASIATSAATTATNTGAAIPTQAPTVSIGGVGIAQDSTSTSSGTTAVAGTSSSSVVGKASAGNLQNAYVTSSAAGWVFIINATSLPSNATLTIGTASGNLQGCFELQKGVTDWGASINYNPGPWEHFSAGIVVAISSTDCPVLTAASTGKFIHSQVN